MFKALSLPCILLHFLLGSVLQADTVARIHSHIIGNWTISTLSYLTTIQMDFANFFPTFLLFCMYFSKLASHYVNYEHVHVMGLTPGHTVPDSVNEMNDYT